MLRFGRWAGPVGSGESSVQVSAAAPGSRLRFEVETLTAERGVESRCGASPRVGWDCGLVGFTIAELSCSWHGAHHVEQSRCCIRAVGPREGTETCRRARSDHGTRDTRSGTGNTPSQHRAPDCWQFAAQHARVDAYLLMTCTICAVVQPLTTAVGSLAYLVRR
jgi:hypothetical protein